MVRYERKKIPSPQNVETYLADVAPDLLVVSPLVNVRSWQTDAVKAAQAIDIPTALCVASWDHLTTKGLIRVRPDKVFVWNHIQKREAWKLHDIKGSRVVVTGAQPFDKWFNRRPSTTRAAFLAKVGLPTDHLFVLFTGSTASISEPRREVDFVKRWIAKLRDNDGALKEIGVLIRPHPVQLRAMERHRELTIPPSPSFPKPEPIRSMRTIAPTISIRSITAKRCWGSTQARWWRRRFLIGRCSASSMVISRRPKGGRFTFNICCRKMGDFSRLPVRSTSTSRSLKRSSPIRNPIGVGGRHSSIGLSARSAGRRTPPSDVVAGLEALAESKQGRQTGAAGAARARLSSEPTRVARPVDG